MWLLIGVCIIYWSCYTNTITVNDNRNSVYKVFQSFIRCIPPFSPFYRRPLMGNIFKFSNQVVGIKKLANYTKDMINEAGFKRNFTGHSGRVTTVTTLYQMGVDGQLIKERTWHRSDAIRSYKRTGSEQQCMVSEILDAPLISEKVSMPSPVRSKRQIQVLHWELHLRSLRRCLMMNWCNVSQPLSVVLTRLCWLRKFWFKISFVCGLNVTEWKFNFFCILCTCTVSFNKSLLNVLIFFYSKNCLLYTSYE